MELREYYISRMKELSKKLTAASKAYYQEDREIMSNLEYDTLYDELVTLEKKTGIVLSGSPTVTVGYESVDILPKVKHPHPMLSLDKTKDKIELANFAGEKEILISWKLDGLTVVLTYRNGELLQAVTRGNGEIGEDVTNNAKAFRNVPLYIPCKEEVVIRGEAVIRYSDFRRINDSIADESAKYKNPRNLCSGAVRQLDSAITAERCVYFYAFSLESKFSEWFQESKERQFDWMNEQGFECVEYVKTTKAHVIDVINQFAIKIQDYDIPSDGLVATYDDGIYGESLGTTAKFPRHSLAFKWKDETVETTLREIEWKPSRTGFINPIAVFDSVELEGTTVNRASLHNLSTVRKLRLGIGDKITVYKANMIIPQIAENLTQSDILELPECCPACGAKTSIRKMNDSEVLFCRNRNCAAKQIKSFELFCSRDAMNIEGLSESTLEKFIERGFLKNLCDIFYLSNYKEEISYMEGFGKKSCEKLLLNIEKAKAVSDSKFLYSLGIPGIGYSTAKLICEHFDHDITNLDSRTPEDFMVIKGIGKTTAEAICGYFADEMNRKMFHDLLYVLYLFVNVQQVASGKIFVITGETQSFANRSEIVKYIEDLGGTVASSVTKNTSYLVNNNRDSNSTKTKKAKELGIPIITELELLDIFSREKS